MVFEPTQKFSTYASTLSENRGWYIAIGIILILLGVGAIAFPVMSSLSVTICVGFVLVIAGLAQAIHAFSYPKWSKLALALLVSLIWFSAGGFLLARPMEGTAALTIVVAAAFLAEGVLKTILAFQLRPMIGWGWALFDGLLAAVLGLMLWWQFPISAFWALGTLAGINILVSGISLIMLTRSAGRSLGSASSQARVF
jgi:uncharacterized membrane protein HdeD (DUF308 family)